MAPSGIVGQAVQNLFDIGINARHRWAGERTGEVTITTMCRAAFDQIEAPIGAGRNRLEFSLRRGRDDDGQCRFRVHVRTSRIVAHNSAQAIGT